MRGEKVSLIRKNDLGGYMFKTMNSCHCERSEAIFQIDAKVFESFSR